MTVQEQIAALCAAFGCDSQAGLAEALATSKQNITHWKAEGRIPERWMWRLSQRCSAGEITLPAEFFAPSASERGFAA